MFDKKYETMMSRENREVSDSVKKFLTEEKSESHLEVKSWQEHLKLVIQLNKTEKERKLETSLLKDMKNFMKPPQTSPPKPPTISTTLGRKNSN